MSRDTVVGNLQELEEFSQAIEAQIAVVKDTKESCMSGSLRAVKRDIDKWIEAYKDNTNKFDEVYEEVTSLYIFSSTYLNPEKVNIEISESAA